MRPSIEVYYLRMARLVATRSTCARRSVGVVLVDARRHVLATGYNGPPSGFPHCRDTGWVTDRACPGRDQASGAGLDLCEAIHAEQNAILQCLDPYAIDTIYSTTAPCVSCAKLLLNTSARHLVFCDDYPSPGLPLWNRAGLKSTMIYVPPFDDRRIDEY